MVAVLSAVARRTLSLAHAAHVIAAHTRGTLALSLATRAIETRAAFFKKKHWLLTIADNEPP